MRHWTWRELQRLQEDLLQEEGFISSCFFKRWCRRIRRSSNDCRLPSPREHGANSYPFLGQFVWQFVYHFSVPWFITLKLIKHLFKRFVQFKSEQEVDVSSSPFKQRLPKRKTEKHAEKRHILQGGSSISGGFFLCWGRRISRSSNDSTL